MIKYQTTAHSEPWFFIAIRKIPLFPLTIRKKRKISQLFFVFHEKQEVNLR